MVLFLLVCPAGLRQRMPGAETGFRKYQKADSVNGKNAYRGAVRHDSQEVVHEKRIIVSHDGFRLLMSNGMNVPYLHK
ncbi:hypothetical protein P4200_01305 [Pseudomonas aeruginosa]|nr:hypothetical protein [Pseudomonas aeruginosa]